MYIVIAFLAIKGVNELYRKTQYLAFRIGSNIARGSQYQCTKAQRVQVMALDGPGVML